ncbi:MAG: sigma-70 family RNA polymerase sigma factor [Vitreoscilla sp.]|nr:sigma-70 family RNA polymerase sigma factor [Vitreoscilla sp.]
MTTDDDHRHWLRLIALRDASSEAAMAQFYRALSGATFAFVQHRLDNPHDAEAVVVETMYEVWRVAGQFSGGSLVKTWLLGIARHKLLDNLRQRGQHRHEDIDDHAEALADDSATAFDQLAGQQQAEWVAQCMARLGDEHRESLHLLFYEGLSVAEIAEIQGVPDGTVKTRVFHAKKKIKACLARWLQATGEVVKDALTGGPGPLHPDAAHG